MLKEKQEMPHNVWFHLHDITRVGKFNRGRKQISSCQELNNLGNGEKLFYGYKVSFGVRKMIWRWIEIILSQHLEYPKCWWIIPIKMVNLYHILFIKSSSDGNIAWAVMNMCLYVYFYKYLFSLLLGMCFGVELLGYMVIFFFFPVFLLLPLSHH